MAKQPFTTRLDEDVLEIAKRAAEAERRSLTSLIEVAILEYANKRDIVGASYAVGVQRHRDHVAKPSRGRKE